MKKCIFAFIAIISMVFLMDIAVSATNVEASENTGWYYDESTSTLTLTNYTSDDVISVGTETCQIYSDGDLNIVLEGTNTLNVESTYGIYVEGHLNISGTGTLKIENTETAIYSSKNIDIDKCTITILEDTTAIYSKAGNITMQSGTVNADGKIVASSARITNKKGTLIASSLEGKEIVIDEGNIAARISGQNLVEINGGIINANGISVDLYKTLKITGGTIVSKVTSGAAIDASASISISGGDITLEGPRGIYGSQMSLNISGGALKIKATNGVGITQTFKMTDGTVEIESTGDGISNVSSEHKISGGTLKIKSGARGIHSDWSGVTISGGYVTIEAETYGLYAGALSSGGLKISGGESFIFGNSQALYSNGYITLGGVYEVGTSADRANIADEYYGEKYLHISYNGNIDTTPKVFPTQLTINGVTTSTNQIGEGWEYNSETKTLTLNNFSSTKTSTIEGIIYQIYSDGDLNVILNGNNNLNSSGAYAIYVDGNLNILGSGSLNVENFTDAIFATKNINIASCNLSIENSTSSIKSKGGNICIEDATINTTGAISTSAGRMTINTGTVMADILSGKEITINGGNVTAKISGKNLVEINGGIINANGISVDLYETLKITGGTIVSKVTSGAAIDASASISISGGDITLEGPRGIYGSQMSLNISGGVLKIKATNGVGITQTFKMTAGSVEIEATGDGISNVSSEHKISGGTLKIKSGARGIHSDWSGVTISGGCVTIEAETYGLYAGALSSGGLKISGGLISITGNEQALYSKGYTNLISNNCIDFYIGNNAESTSNTVDYYGEKYVGTKESHSWNSGSVTTNPTHLTEGIRTYTCNNCSNKKYESIPKSPTHEFGSWTYVDNINHKRECPCGEIESVSHTWSDATCTAKSKCDVCNTECGELNGENHSKITTIYEINENDPNSHDKKHECCGAIIETSPHSGGTATCASKAKCDICKQIYGDFNTNNHTATISWTNSNDQHYHACTNGCDAKLDIADCAGGTATCQEKAKCDVCKSTYGDLGEHNYDENSWGYQGTDGHAHSCQTSGCTAHDTIIMHTSSGAATEYVAETCTKCGYIISPALGHKKHTAKTEWTTDDKYHWHECTGCEGQQLDKSSHKDLDNNAKCDACGANIPVGTVGETDEDVDSNGDGLSGGAIAGIAVGSTAVVGVGGFSLIWFVIKKKSWADLLAVFKK